MNLSLVWRMVVMIVTYLPIALVPFCIAIFNKDKWSDYDFSKDKIRYQVLIGLVIALCMSFVFAIALVEEFVFRGFFYTKMETLFGSSTGASVGSLLLFGLFHFLSGNIVQILLTGIIGAIFGVCRVRIKNCMLLSLIIAHGVYDALITVWLNVFT